MHHIVTEERKAIKLLPSSRARKLTSDCITTDNMLANMTMKTNLSPVKAETRTRPVRLVIRHNGQKYDVPHMMLLFSIFRVSIINMQENKMRVNRNS